MFKSQLQEFAQKAALPPPSYEFLKEGLPHMPRFKAVVTINGVSYESAGGYPSLKSAEHAAAKVALDSISCGVMGNAKVTPPVVYESGLCKNLLQEYAQKSSLPLPVYRSTRSGADHAPAFTSIVEIAGVKYSGGMGRSKKEAEIKAARTALLAIQTKAVPYAVSQLPFDQGQLLSTTIMSGYGKKRLRYPAEAADEDVTGRVKKPHSSSPRLLMNVSGSDILAAGPSDGERKLLATAEDKKDEEKPIAGAEQEQEQNPDVPGVAASTQNEPGSEPLSQESSLSQELPPKYFDASQQQGISKVLSASDYPSQTVGFGMLKMQQVLDRRELYIPQPMPSHSFFLPDPPSSVMSPELRRT